ncbi:hypothetical protein [Marinoscillum furvescens]|uniref:Uncharacterized protein n=1 Tax=Marinoscillum furvescens DSM 4134 TaxID=1122208 RepID=A0A3D9L103_MARFU|nr:hypothetical protein [Marinoscillum furvescens]RED97432.1 hypothetical protein C7460_11241 [Marinoscillum furvescens DSM 4134]
MACVTGKKAYPTKERALEALVDQRGRFEYRSNSGPINVYHCDDCGEWHFTSKGDMHEYLQSADIQKRIADQREAEYWERKLR